LKIGIVTDIHEDIEKLKKTILSFEKMNCDEIVCLGDIVGFCLPFYTYQDTRNANECVNIVKKNCSTVVVGNHDLNAIKKIPAFRNKTQYPEDWYELSPFKKKQLLEGKVWLYEGELLHNLNNENIEYLKNLNEYEIRNFGGINILFSHFIYPNFSGSNCFFPSFEYNLNSYFEFIEKKNCKFGIFGHLHPNGILMAKKSKNKLLSIFKAPFYFIDNMVVNINLDVISCFTVPSMAYYGQKHSAVILETTKFELTLF